MKKIITTISGVLLITLMIFWPGFGQSIDKKGASGSRTTSHVSKTNPKHNSINKQHDGVIYERRLNSAAARRSVRSNFGFKATKLYVGKSTKDRFETRKSEHAHKLGVSKKDLDMKIVNRTYRKNLPAAEQSAIRRRGGVEKLANKRNAISPKSWDVLKNSPRQAPQRGLRGH